MATFDVAERNALPQPATEQLLDSNGPPEVLWTAENGGNADYQTYSPPTGTAPAYFQP